MSSSTAAAAGIVPAPQPPTPSAGPPTPADLRTAVNQIQSLLLLLDSTSDLSQPASSEDEAALLSAATPRGGTIADLAPAAQEPPAAEAAPAAEPDADDAASDSSDAPLMQQRSAPAPKPAAPPPASAPPAPSNVGTGAAQTQPGLAQMLPALLLPLQPATPALIAQLNLESVAMGFPNLMSRYRGAVQHAFNLVGDLQRGIGMLSAPMPDPAHPSRTRDAALPLAARLMRSATDDQRDARVKRVAKRQRTAEPPAQEEAETPAPALPQRATSKRQPPLRLPAAAVERVPHGGAPRAALEAYCTAAQAHLAQRGVRAVLSVVRMTAGGAGAPATAIMRVSLLPALIGFVHLALPASPEAPAVVLRVTVRAPAEESARSAAGQPGGSGPAGLDTLPFAASRFPAFRAIGSAVFARCAEAAGGAGALSARPDGGSNVEAAKDGAATAEKSAQDAQDTTAYSPLGTAILHLAAHASAALPKRLAPAAKPKAELKHEAPLPQAQAQE